MQVEEIHKILKEDRSFFLSKKEKFLKCIDIGSINDTAQKLYISLFSFEKNEKDIEKLIRELLRHRADIKPEITSFLMNLVNEYLEYCIKNKKSIKNVKALLQLINHYIYLIDKTYISYVSHITNHIKQLSKEKRKAHKELALSIFRKLKEEKKSVRLVSFYKEVPIICKTKIERITDEFVVLQSHNCSTKAFYPEKNVYIKIDNLQKKIKATIINIIPKEEKIVLGNFELTQLPQEKRKFVRVQPTENIEVKLQKGKHILTGKLSDISIGGIGVYLSKIDNIEEKDTVKISFKLPSGDTEIELLGEVVYIMDMDGMYRVGIKYSPDVLTEEKINDYVINRQFEILKEIKS
ncbi:MAG: PilZ domain-containing protein [Aquificae bacterium]|nr:PilZ domain-containing protein [Aquificota bacterium]